jgi:hypothetical protein
LAFEEEEDVLVLFDQSADLFVELRIRPADPTLNVERTKPSQQCSEERQSRKLVLRSDTRDLDTKAWEMVEEIGADHEVHVASMTG